MTTELAQKRSRNAGNSGEFSILAARLVLIWERYWPAVLPALAVPYLFVIFGMFGGVSILPFALHWAALAIGAVLFALVIWRRTGKVSWPTRRDAQARLEADGAVKHAALQALDDEPFEGPGNPLWEAHQKENRRRASAARLAGVRATASDGDPWGFRFIALGVFAIALIAARGEPFDRIVAAFSPDATRSPGALVADVWVEPPEYTGKAPIYLMRSGETKNGDQEQVNMPEGSRLVAQVTGRRKPKLEFSDGETLERAEFDRNRKSSRGELEIASSGVVFLRSGGVSIRWPVGVFADTAPLVSFEETPSTDERALLTFAYSVADDYAIVAGALHLRLDPDQERPLDAPVFDAAATGETREIVLDDAAGAPGARFAELDLQADPWAGLDVIAKLVVVDGAGQVGASDETTFTLPTRKFFNPLAKSVVEQRQALSVAAEKWPRVGRSLDAVTMAPEAFFDESGEYLMLRAAFWRVMRQDGEGFDDAVDEFWPLALQLEDEALELARQRLQAAEEALRKALEEGASDTEISRLVEELREAMNDYLAALAQSGEAMASQGSAGGMQQLGQSDLDQMLDSIRDLSESGAQNAARQMLSDLENILENLRLSQSGSGGGQGQGQGGEGQSGAAGQAGDLIGRQRELADETFERGQGFGEPGDDLAEREGRLGGELDDLIDELQGGGDDPNGDAARQLGRARNEMRDAEQALRSGDFDAANTSMERAIERLREGAEELAREQMRQAEGEGGEGRGRAPRDPLGRETGNAFGGGVEVPEISDADRRRQIIENLRDRLGEPGRSDEEIDYLERLLERF
ncbi:MAG: DUF4175 family protein [Marinicaulis sp.]|nr:DUF4175 family protein [Marinicaulis sp.]